MAAAPCLAGELELSGHGLGDHGLTLGEIAVGHEGGDIGLEEIGLLNVYCRILSVFGPRCNVKSRIISRYLLTEEHEIGEYGGHGGHYVPIVKSIGEF